MSDNLDSLLREAVDDAKAIFKDKLVSVILFGSYARGDFDTESDIDVMIIADIHADETPQYRVELNKTAGRLSLNTESCTTFCILLQDTATFRKYQNYLPFYRNILNEGVTLYAS